MTYQRAGIMAFVPPLPDSSQLPDGLKRVSPTQSASCDKALIETSPFLWVLRQLDSQHIAMHLKAHFLGCIYFLIHGYEVHLQCAASKL
jgi:hypothetical protein